MGNVEMGAVRRPLNNENVCRNIGKDAEFR